MKEKVEKIHDKPIRDCMLKANAFLKQGEIDRASQKMFEALAAFKFKMFDYFSDFRVQDFEFEKKGFKIDMANLVGDLAFKLIFANDVTALQLINEIGSHFEFEEGQIKTVSKYRFPIHMNKDYARQHYNEILRIITTYQDQVPKFVWRS